MMKFSKFCSVLSISVLIFMNSCVSEPGTAQPANTGAALQSASPREEGADRARIEQVTAPQPTRSAEADLAQVKPRLNRADSIQGGSQYPLLYTQELRTHNLAVELRYDGDDPAQAFIPHYFAQAANNAFTLEVLEGRQDIAQAAPVATSMGVTETLAQEEQTPTVSVEELLEQVKDGLNWATLIDAKIRYPLLYSDAVSASENANNNYNEQNQDAASSNATKALAAIEEIRRLEGNAAALAAEGQNAEGGRELTEEEKAKAAAEASDLLAQAKDRLGWANSIQAQTKFPQDYSRANNAYNTATRANNSGNYPAAITNAQATIDAVAEIERLSKQTDAERAAEASKLLAQAKGRLDWANSIQARTKFSQPFNQANTAYNNATRANTSKDYPAAINNAKMTIDAVAEIEKLNTAAVASAGGGKQPGTTTSSGQSVGGASSGGKDESSTGPGELGEDGRKLDSDIAREVNELLKKAKEELDWADENLIKKTYSFYYSQATTSYNKAVRSLFARQYDQVKTGANTTIRAVEQIRKQLEEKEAE